MTHRIPFLLLLPLFLLCSCGGEEVPAPVAERPLPSLTVMFSTTGLGDMGYNDQLQAGMLRFYQAHRQEVWLSALTPRSEDEAWQLFTEWLREAATPAPAGRLLVLATTEYAGLLERASVSLAPGHHILLLESAQRPWPQGVSTIDTQLYGISYVAGRLMAGQGFTHALALLGMPGYPQLEGGAAGLRAGMDDGAPGQATTIVSYLADDESGFARTEEAMRQTLVLSQQPEAERSFVYPLCGGAARGVYRFLNTRLRPVAIGMDGDCGPLCVSIPFSVTKDVGGILQARLEDWLAGKPMPPHHTYGLREGFLSIRPNSVRPWPTPWESLAQALIPTAIEKEKEYEKSRP